MRLSYNVILFDFQFFLFFIDLRTEGPGVDHVGEGNMTKRTLSNMLLLHVTLGQFITARITASV